MTKGRDIWRIRKVPQKSRVWGWGDLAKYNPFKVQYLQNNKNSTNERSVTQPCL